MPMIQLAILPYPHIKALVKAGSKGYYIDRGGFITIILPEESMECEFPGTAEFDDMPPEIRQVFSRDWEDDFRKNLAHLLTRSNLSDPAAR